METSFIFALGALSFGPQDVFASPVNLLRNLGAVDEVIVADFDGDNFGDVVVRGGAVGVSRSPLVQSAPSVSVIGAGPGSASAVAAGDLDGDGLDEVFVQREGPGFVAWDWFDGGASGESFVFGGRALSPPSAVRLQVADIDGDGDGDIVAELGAGTLQWFSNDGGTISSTGTTVVTSVASDWTLRDLNGSGTADLVVHDDAAGELRIFPSSSGGSFGPPISIATLPAGELNGWAVLDDDGDGDFDVLFATQGECRRVENFGAMIFGAPVTVTAATATLEVIKLRSGADLDGDGNVDLVLVMRAPGFFNFPTTLVMGMGDGSYATPIRAPFEYGAPSTLADMDGDLDADSVGVRSQGIEVQVATSLAGVPSLNDSDPVQIGISRTAARPQAIVDLEGDGDLDVVVLGEEGIVALRSRGSAASFEAVTLTDPLGSTVTWSTVTPGDFNGDGQQELVCVDDSGRIAILEIVGDILTPALAQPNQLGGTLARGVSVVDFNGDGNLDIACLGWSSDSLVPLVLHVNGGAGASWSSLIVGGVSGSAGPNRSYAFEDLDGDGLTDVLMQQRVFPFQQTLRRQGTVSGALGPIELVLGDGAMGQLVDLDGDGLGDIVTPDFSPQYALRNPGTATYGSSSGAIADLFPVPVHFPFFRDLDGDGLVDCLAFQDPSGSDGLLWIHSGLPGLAFSAGTLEFGPTATLPLFADLDDDGDLDALLLEEVSGRPTLLIYRGLSRPQAGEAMCAPAAVNSSGASAQMIGFGEVTPGSTDLELRTVAVPGNSFGILVVSMTPTAPTPVVGSAGRLCLGGAIGRYDGPGQVLQATPAGEFRLSIDPSRIPQPSGLAAAQAGQTWGFQTWFRDTVGGAATGNFSDALVLTF